MADQQMDATKMMHSDGWHMAQQGAIAEKLRGIQERARMLAMAFERGTFDDSIDDFRAAANNAKCILGDASDMQTMVERYLRIVETEGGDAADVNG